MAHLMTDPKVNLNYTQIATLREVQYYLSLYKFGNKRKQIEYIELISVQALQITSVLIRETQVDQFQVFIHYVGMPQSQPDGTIRIHKIEEGKENDLLLNSYLYISFHIKVNSGSLEGYQYQRKVIEILQGIETVAGNLVRAHLLFQES